MQSRESHLVDAGSRSSIVRCATVARAPIAPTKPTGRSSATCRAGMSRRSSWVRTHTAVRASSVAWSRRARYSCGRRDDDLLGLGESLRRRHEFPHVADRDRESGRRGDPAQRRGVLARAEDDQARTRGMREHEHGSSGAGRSRFSR